MSELTESDIAMARADYESVRQAILAEVGKTKTPDEAVQAGYNLGYGKGFQDGLSYGYAEGVDDERMRNS